MSNPPSYAPLKLEPTCLWDIRFNPVDMNFQSLFFLIPITSGFITAAIGFFISKNPPKNRGGMFGYRTVNSLKSQEAWDMAQVYWSKEMLKSGLFLMLISPFGLLVSGDSELALILGSGIMIFFVLIPIIRTEKMLRGKFDKE